MLASTPTAGMNPNSSRQVQRFCTNPNTMPSVFMPSARPIDSTLVHNRVERPHYPFWSHHTNVFSGIMIKRSQYNGPTPIRCTMRSAAHRFFEEGLAGQHHWVLFAKPIQRLTEAKLFRPL
jgi:hypothetical protein